MAVQPRIRVKRIYAEPARSDGRRVLVDRLWPRGIRKDDAALDEWLKDVAPSAELRKWFAHAPERWQTFRARYTAELARNKAAFDRLAELCRKDDVTLLYAARDDAHNNAVVLKELLERKTC